MRLEIRLVPVTERFPAATSPIATEPADRVASAYRPEPPTQHAGRLSESTSCDHDKGPPGRTAERSTASRATLLHLARKSAACEETAEIGGTRWFWRIRCRIS